MPRGILLKMILAGCLASGVLLAVFAMVLQGERKTALAQATQHANNLALLVERDITRNLELFGLSLQAIVDGWGKPEVASLAPELQRALLFDRSITARNVVSAAVLDADGHVALSLRHAVPPSASFSDRDYFRVHLDDVDTGLYLSAPFASRVDGSVNLALSKRLANADGTFAGVAVLFLDVRYLRELLADLQIGQGGRTSILTSHGNMVMTQPYTAELEGQNRQQSPIFRRAVEREANAFIQTSAIDGKERLFITRQTKGPRLLVIMALATEDIYAPWRRQAAFTGGAALGMAIGVVLLAASIGLRWQQRKIAEGHLLTLVDTDGLTGLANRRALDHILAEEANRLGRAQPGLAILFIDVDDFKKYNDSLGHLEGDKVLIMIANSLLSTIQRPGDHVARYGGEEFVVVLAQTSSDGALRMAEQIRHAVEALAIPHETQAHKVVTVSIGVATAAESSFKSSAELVRAADAALYMAKSLGKNRVESANGR